MDFPDQCGLRRFYRAGYKARVQATARLSESVDVWESYDYDANSHHCAERPSYHRYLNL